MKSRLIIITAFIPILIYAQAPKELLPILEVAGTDTNGRLGDFVRGVGDLNQDHYADVAISESGLRKTFIYFGGKSMTKVPSLALRGGGNIVSGDFNHDGWIDLAIEIYGHDTVLVYYGGPTTDTVPDVILHSPRGHIDFYGMVMATGDINGDGFDDLAIVENDVNPADSMFARGIIDVYGGGESIDTIPRISIIGDTIRAGLGKSLVLGDINKDGKRDLLAMGYNGANLSSQYQFYYLAVYLGDSVFQLNRNYYIDSRNIPGRFDHHVDSFDADSDGVDDILVNRIAIFSGGDQIGPMPTYYVYPPYGDTVTYGPRPRVSGGGDYNHDGIKDILLSSTEEYYGGAPGVFIMFGKKGSPGHFGAFRVWSACCGIPLAGTPENAGDVNGDGVDDIIIGVGGEPYPVYKGFFGIYSGDSSIIASVRDDKTQSPEIFHLDQNYPNPFNPQTVIGYTLTRRQHVRILIFDGNGKEITTLVNQFEEVGKHQSVWDGKDRFGNRVSSGPYYYEMITPENRSTKKMIYLK